ncbi:hypothetical protein L9F63_021112, partial [Diploptera punctata]
ILPQKEINRPSAGRNSNPVTTERITMTSLVSSVSTLLLDNVREHRKLDRSQSEPAPSAVSAKAANINTSRYKTELCRPYEESGSCKYGDKCQFAHGSHELRNLVRHPKYKTELCRTFHTIGFCPYGPRCHFIHNADEARTKIPLAAITAPSRPKPLTLSGSPFVITGSTADSPSPTSSLSQSPTSVGSFFPQDQDVFSNSVTLLSASSPPPSASANTAFSFGQDFTPLVQLGAKQSPPGSPPGSISPSGSLSPRESPPPGTPETRLPVFNRLSSSKSYVIYNFYFFRYYLNDLGNQSQIIIYFSISSQCLIKKLDASKSIRNKFVERDSCARLSNSHSVSRIYPYITRLRRIDHVTLLSMSAKGNGTYILN